MEIIRDAARLNHLIEQEQLQSHFQTKNLNFRLLQYHRKEILNSPVKPLKDFLYVVEGQIQIYGIRADGSIYTVTTAGHGAVLGEMEFCQEETSPLITEALEDTLCISLPVEAHRAVLEQDALFLNYLLRSCVKKISLISKIDLISQSLEDKVLMYLREIQPEHKLCGIHQAVIYFHCSRRQLQRVLRDLCERGILKKLGKGEYVLEDDTEAELV